MWTWLFLVDSLQHYLNIAKLIRVSRFSKLSCVIVSRTNVHQHYLNRSWIQTCEQVQLSVLNNTYKQEANPCPICMANRWYMHITASTERNQVQLLQYYGSELGIDVNEATSIFKPHFKSTKYFFSGTKST